MDDTTTSLLLPLLHPSDSSSHRPERADAVHNRQLILSVARQLFALRGVENVSMGDIIHHAQVGKGTLYRRFAHKGELCLALMDEALRDFQNEVLGQLREMAEEEAGYEARIGYFLGRLLTFTLANLPYLAEVQKAAVGNRREEFDFPHLWSHLTLKGLLSLAQQAGELSADLDVPYLTLLLLSSLHSSALRLQCQQYHFSAERLHNGLRGLLHQLFLGPEPQI